MPHLGQITLFLSCCNERNARKLGETEDGQRDFYLFLMKPSTKTWILGTLLLSNPRGRKPSLPSAARDALLSFNIASLLPSPTSCLSFGNFHYMDTGTYIFIPMTLKFFCQTFHFFLQCILLARYSNSREVFLFCFVFSNSHVQSLVIPVAIPSTAAYFFFNWLYVMTS